MPQLMEPKSNRKMTVKPIYGFTVDGVEVILKFSRPGGHEAIEVHTEQFRTRLFALRNYQGDEQRGRLRGTNIVQLAQDICTFVFTGQHPTDRNWPGVSHWGSELSRDYAEEIVGRMIEEAWEEHAH